jgi:hypothetical protein
MLMSSLIRSSLILNATAFLASDLSHKFNFASATPNPSLNADVPHAGASPWQRAAG